MNLIRNMSLVKERNRTSCNDAGPKPGIYVFGLRYLGCEDGAFVQSRNSCLS